MKILLTGGAGFIGSALVREIIQHTSFSVVNVDKLTYAGNLSSLKPVADSERYEFHQVDIGDDQAIAKIFVKTQPDAVMHLAAESHVDRSIDGPAEFIQTNIVGTFSLLENSRKYYESLEGEKRDNFRFHHISTDEVYGDVDEEGLFTETTPYAPNSPYSASKASSDHLVRAWHRTYGFPVLVTNCSNNYGPYHFPEKLIPHVIINALKGLPLPIYGEGRQVRDWLHVEDHARALLVVLQSGLVGETYNIGGHNERQNLQVVHSICDRLDALRPIEVEGLSSYRELIKHVRDRPGHDLRYAIDASKMQNTLGWAPKETFESGIAKTVDWYLENEQWWSDVLDGSYQLGRLGDEKS